MYSIPGTQNRSSDLNVYPPFWGSLQLGHDQRYSLSIGLPKLACQNWGCTREKKNSVKLNEVKTFIKTVIMISGAIR